MRGFHLHHQTCTCNLAWELGFGKPSFLSKRAESGLLEHSVGKYPKKVIFAYAQFGDLQVEPWLFIII